LRITTEVEVVLPEGGASLGELELLIGRAVHAAACEMLITAAGQVEQVALARLHEETTVQRVKTRTLDLLTRFGWVRLRRLQVLDTKAGLYLYPADKALGLRPRQHVSPWVAAAAADLTGPTSVRRAALSMERLLGTKVDYRTLWAWRERSRPRPRSKRSPRVAAAATAAPRRTAP
jgi:uncharacterized protein UPF0236